MAKADRVYITPPLTASAIDHPMMFPPRDPTRRQFLTVATVASVVSAGSLAAAAMAPNVPQAVTVGLKPGSEGGADMSSIIEFPIADKPITESEIDKLHSEAFRDLETNLRDCVRMCGIAAELMLNAKVEDDSLRFAVFHAAEMLMRLEKEYDAGWHGERSEP